MCELFLVDPDLLVNLLLKLLPNPLLLLTLVDLPALSLLLHLELVLLHNLLLFELEIPVNLLDGSSEILLKELPLLLKVLIYLCLNERILMLGKEGVRASP